MKPEPILWSPSPRLRSVPGLQFAKSSKLSQFKDEDSYTFARLMKVNKQVPWVEVRQVRQESRSYTYPAYAGQPAQTRSYLSKRSSLRCTFTLEGHTLWDPKGGNMALQANGSCTPEEYEQFNEAIAECRKVLKQLTNT